MTLTITLFYSMFFIQTEFCQPILIEQNLDEREKSLEGTRNGIPKYLKISSSTFYLPP